jgi:PKD repeat protein
MQVVPRTDVDRSQDGPDFAALRNWVRSNTPAANRTQTLTATAPATIDFTGTPRRQIVNGDVAFTLIGANQAASVEWSFGDGQTSAELNPVHQYTETGFYTVSVAVTNQFGVTTTVTKTEYIEILATPYVDFSATPTRGNITPDPPVPALAVTFTDLSVGDTCFVPVGWYWNFGDGQSSTERNPVHTATRFPASTT